ncbi:MAG: cupredoxin domain-containing protein [Deltaproteobacteria bacterium]|nr:cupredoxin domain-containing protein [Deltaproteobacteria bacterium]MBI3293327.1 cupredoxin domain-containing protein [Deltaproteobacteria bacterium]
MKNEMKKLGLEITMIVGLLGGVAQAATVTVMVSDGGFRPNRITIQQGDTVNFLSDARFTHTVTANPALAKDPANVVLPMGAPTFNSGDLTKGQSFTQTFDVAGNYQYVCLQHEKFGMIGQIVVEGADEE